MARIAVIGGTGYAGRNIVAEAVDRGHTVVSVARTVPAERVEGATYIEGTLLDSPSLVAELQGVDVVVVTVPARGDMEGSVRPNVAELVASLPQNVRMGVIGGAGGSQVSEGGPRLFDVSAQPPEVLPEIQTGLNLLEALQRAPESLDWFYISPAATFGAWNPERVTGTYRISDDVLLSDDRGESYISATDLALAVLDEIEQPRYHRRRFHVAL